MIIIKTLIICFLLSNALPCMVSYVKNKRNSKKKDKKNSTEPKVISEFKQFYLNSSITDTNLKLINQISSNDDPKTKSSTSYDCAQIYSTSNKECIDKTNSIEFEHSINIQSNKQHDIRSSELSSDENCVETINIRKSKKKNSKQLVKNILSSYGGIISPIKALKFKSIKRTNQHYYKNKCNYLVLKSKIY